MSSALPPPRGAGFRFADRSGRAPTDLGIDRRKDKVLEVAAIWSDTVVEVRHVPRGEAVTLGDGERPSLRWASGLLVAALVLGVGALMIAHARVATPPLLPLGDADRIEAWEQARAAALAVPAPVEAEEPEAAAPPRAVPDGLYGAPGWEGFVRDELLPGALELAERGELSRSHAAALAALPRAHDAFDDLEEPRVAADVALGTRVRVPGDEAVWTVVPGALGSLQALSDRAPVHLAAGTPEQRRERTVAADSELLLWAPTPAEAAALEGIYAGAQRALFAQADAVASPRARCAAADALVEFEPTRFDLHAVRARCLADRGDWDGVADAVGRARRTDPGASAHADLGLDPERYADLRMGLLEADARRALVAATASPEADPALRAAAEEAHQTLRAWIIDAVQDPVALRASAEGIHRLGVQRAQEQRSVHVKRAVALGAAVLLLLPLGLRFDERRSRRRSADFVIPEDRLPSDPFRLASYRAETTVQLPLDVPCSLRGPGEDVPLGDLLRTGRVRDVEGVHTLTLADDERLVATFGDTTFLVHHVPAAKAVAGARSGGVDGLFLGVLAALMFIGASLGVHLMTSDYEPGHEVVEMPEHFVRIPMQIEEKPLESGPKPLQDTPDPGDRPQESEGRVGDRDSKLPTAKGARTAVRKAEQDRRTAEMAGILPEIEALLASNDLYGGGGDSSEWTVNLGSHLGTQYGRQRGTGGTWSRGAGTGGGGDAQFIGGVGIGGIPGGGDPKSHGIYAETKTTKVPPSGGGDPIVFGGLKKSLIDRIVRQNLPQFRYCYERELQKNPELAGKIVMKWVIAKDGTVSSSSVKGSSLDNPLVESCMITRVRRLRFPPPKGGGIVLVSYPFVFNAR